jgi:anaerobic selenocysteine-containing dehydrogenase
MSNKITRRTFLKLSGVGAAAAAVLTGCGPAARYVTRKPYYDMPEYAKLGESTYFATTCRECPAGCGLIMRTMEGRAIKAEGNPAHPVSQGKICSRGLTAVQGLYNPDRNTGPVKRSKRGETAVTEIEWNEGFDVVAKALKNGGQAAILMGLAPDHLYDLTSELAQAVGAPAPVRYSTAGILEGRGTLIAATLKRFGQAALPYFDLAKADLVFAFGGDFLSTWLSPVSYGKAYGAFRRSSSQKRRGYLVSFEPRMGVTSGSADEWIPVTPGSEGLVAQAIARLVAEIRGENGGGADIATIIQASGVSEEKLHHLAELFAAAQSPLAIPGGSALNHGNGLATADAVLMLNANRVGQPGGMFLTPALPAEESQPNLPGSFNQVQDLVKKMEAGQVKALLIHGVNPLFDLPPTLGFEKALEKVELVISFSSFPDETAQMSDYVLPDHTALESFGYQTRLPGTPQNIVSAMQPVVVPLYKTLATADVLLEAARLTGAGLAYKDEVDFLQARISPLLDQNGSITAATVESFWAHFLQFGGWWRPSDATVPAVNSGAPVGIPVPMVKPGEEGEFHLITYATHFGDGSGANRPWLQETPDPMTTVTWNSWVEINPKTAEEMGIHHDDLVKVKSAAGEVEAAAYLYPAIRPDTVAMPFGQGHTALGRYAEGRGVNPLALVEVKVNAAGDLALSDTLVTIEKTGRKRPLARMESIKGVYGEH